jgi:hypothetical protein
MKTLMDSNSNVHAVIGNHDFAYIHKEIAGRSSGWNSTTYTLINAPENKKLKDWLMSLPIVLELDGVTFSHAGITEEWNGEFDVWSLWEANSPIWARPDEFGGNITYKNIKQVFGHNPSPTIWTPAKNAWCIDTFSEYTDNTPVGDFTVLEIIGGKKFNIRKLKEIKNENNSNTAGLEDSVS